MRNGNSQITKLSESQRILKKNHAKDTHETIALIDRKKIQSKVTLFESKKSQLNNNTKYNEKNNILNMEKNKIYSEAADHMYCVIL